MQQEAGKEVSGVSHLHDLLGTPRPKLKHLATSQQPPLASPPPPPATVAVPEAPLNRTWIYLGVGLFLLFVVIGLITR
jgi:hypothetical protein